jgi:hypothetical protein
MRNTLFIIGVLLCSSVTFANNLTVEPIQNKCVYVDSISNEIINVTDNVSAEEAVIIINAATGEIITQIEKAFCVLNAGHIIQILDNDKFHIEFNDDRTNYEVYSKHFATSMQEIGQFETKMQNYIANNNSPKTTLCCKQLALFHIHGVSRLAAINQCAADAAAEELLHKIIAQNSYLADKATARIMLADLHLNNRTVTAKLYGKDAADAEAEKLLCIVSEQFRDTVSQESANSLLFKMAGDKRLVVKLSEHDALRNLKHAIKVQSDSAIRAEFQMQIASAHMRGESMLAQTNMGEALLEAEYLLNNVCLQYANPGAREAANEMLASLVLSNFK